MDAAKAGTYQANILVVDDDLADLHFLVGMLKERQYKARSALGGKMGLQVAQIELPDLILLDTTMPEMDGYQVCARLKADRALKDIPVIFIGGQDGNLDLGKVFRAGGADFISKAFPM